MMAIGSVLIAGMMQKPKANACVAMEKPMKAMPVQKIAIRRDGILIPKARKGHKGSIQEASCMPISYPEPLYGRQWDDEDIYLLAKLAMVEAEGESVQCKTLVIMVALNRAADDSFPDSIQDVVFEYDPVSGVYQFSGIGNGRWDRVEPDQECYEAVSVVQASGLDYSGGALYFESCEEAGSWHSQHLEFLYQCGGIRFYK